MVQAQKDTSDLFQRMRDRFDTDEKCRACVNDIIASGREVWRVPKLHQVQLMSKNLLMKVLYYCPESNYYYDSEEVMTDMKERWSKFKVLQEVKELITRVITADEVKISEAHFTKE